ncbi:multicopper oxidase-domain-containing protein [Lipomyces tetrasporus]|uniref:Multicopper oxidase-domain-containing protein n=1 Tax=Lipomyces tetrasporus TaxID=54092 RepID=A0AAD7QY88_9ASCO|nr:multicopper oxidase-domain-containing protein [Lipomyces tetrasporus]KAJ8103654.1 multicopper oxidase-domain-containing protein [Lipomyces tetrasporus]
MKYIATLLSLLAAPAYAAVVREYDLNLTASYQAPNGFYREVFLVNGQQPGPLIEADEGDTIITNVHNNLQVPITIHFHGIHQVGTPWMDGFPGVTQRPIFPGESFLYNFTTVGQYGSYWYHAHVRSYYQDALERNPTPLYVMDWTKLTSDALYYRDVTYGLDPACVLGFLVNGNGRVTCPSNELITTAGAGRLATFEALFGAQSSFDSLGCLDLSAINGFSGINNVALESPGFSTPCQSSTTDREIFYVNGSEWMMLNVINMGGGFGTYLSIDGHDMWVLQVEGIFIQPQKVKQLHVGLGSRYIIAVQTVKNNGDFSIRFASSELPQVTEQIAWLSYNQPTATQPLDYPVPSDIYQDIGGNLYDPENMKSFNESAAAPYDDDIKPPQGPAQHTIHFTLNRTSIVGFSVMDSGAEMPSDMELMTPLLWADDLNQPTTVDVGIKLGDVVDLIIYNMPQAPHPIHLHGHSFWVVSESNLGFFGYSSVEVAIANGSSTLNLNNPPYRDGYTVAPSGHAVFRYVADNPGAWMLHCHINMHLMVGMGAVILEDREAIRPSIPSSVINF